MCLSSSIVAPCHVDLLPCLSQNVSWIHSEHTVAQLPRYNMQLQYLSLSTKLYTYSFKRSSAPPPYVVLICFRKLRGCLLLWLPVLPNAVIRPRRIAHCNETRAAPITDRETIHLRQLVSVRCAHQKNTASTALYRRVLSTLYVQEDYGLQSYEIRLPIQPLEVASVTA